MEAAHETELAPENYSFEGERGEQVNSLQASDERFIVSTGSRNPNPYRVNWAWSPLDLKDFNRGTAGIMFLALGRSSQKDDEISDFQIFKAEVAWSSVENSWESDRSDIAFW